MLSVQVNTFVSIVSTKNQCCGENFVKASNSYVKLCIAKFVTIVIFIILEMNF